MAQRRERFPVFLLLFAALFAPRTHADGGVVGGFGGPFLRFGPIADETAVFLGGRGGVLFDSGFYLGGEGAGTVNRFADDRRLGYGGVFAGLWVPLGAVTDGAVEVLVGGGGVGRRHQEPDRVFIVRPALRVGIQAAPWLRATADLGWRAVSLSDTPSLGDGKLSAWELSLGLAFGAPKPPVLE